MGKISFNNKPIGEGSFRWAFEATVTEGPYLGWEKGAKLIFKAMKPERYNQGFRVTKADIEMQQRCSELAGQFTREVKPTKDGKPCPLYMRVAKLDTIDADKYDNQNRLIFRKGERTAIEQRIFGEWEKFNSNSGWSSRNASLPDAFSHWTWVKSGGDLLVCDLQGHRGRPGGPKYDGHEHYYVLTDPAIISKDGRFGDTDLGFDGMCDWFRQHRCTAACKTMGLEGKTPAQPANAAGRAGARSSVFRQAQNFRKRQREDDTPAVANKRPRPNQPQQQAPKPIQRQQQGFCNIM